MTAQLPARVGPDGEGALLVVLSPTAQAALDAAQALAHNAAAPATLRGYVQRAGLVDDSPAGALDL